MPDLSAFAGYPLAVSAARNAVVSYPLIAVDPIVVMTVSPASGSVVNDNPDLVRKSLVLSHGVNVVEGKTKTCKLHALAATEIGVAFWNCSSAGLIACVSARNSGKYVSAANRHPARMILSRPTRSESDPKITKNGSPIRSETPISVYAVCQSSLSVMVRKKRA